MCASDFRLNLPGNRVEIGPLARVEFGVDEFIIDANFEGAAAGLDQLRIHAGRFTNASRQTGGFRFVVSGRAVFDRDFRFHARLLHLPYAMRPRRRCRGSGVTSNHSLDVWAGFDGEALHTITFFSSRPVGDHDHHAQTPGKQS